MGRFARHPPALPVLLCLLGCGTEAPTSVPYPAPAIKEAGNIVAQIGDVSLTDEEFRKRVEGQSPFLRAQLTKPERARRFIDTEIRAEVLAQEAWRQGLHKDPALLGAFKKMLIQHVVRDIVKKRGSELKVEDADLRKAYSKHYDTFNKPELVRLWKVTRTAAHEEQQEINAQFLKSMKKKIEKSEAKGDRTLASKLAEEHSQDPESAARGGDLGFMSYAQAETEFGEAQAKRLFEEIPIHGMFVFSTDKEVVLLKKTGRRRPVTQTLERVKQRLRSEVMANKKAALLQSYVRELSSSHGYQISEEKLNALAQMLVETAQAKGNAPPTWGQPAKPADPGADAPLSGSEEAAPPPRTVKNNHHTATRPQEQAGNQATRLHLPTAYSVGQASGRR